MKRLQLQRWSRSVFSPRTRIANPLHQHTYGRRYQSTVPSDRISKTQQNEPIVKGQVPKAVETEAGVTQAEETRAEVIEAEETKAGETEAGEIEAEEPEPEMTPAEKLEFIVKGSHLHPDRLQYPSPPVSAAKESAKLAALHARLYLPSRLPVETLARTLVDTSADPDPNFNNASLATLGHDLLSYYASEHLICTYPRLPLTVIFAAMYAYAGPKTLAAMAREWGVELAAIPGGEVDPGLLQFRRVEAGADVPQPPPHHTARPYETAKHWRKTVTSKIFYDDEFGDPLKGTTDPAAGVTSEQASADFVRAVMGSIYLHAGRAAAKRFFEQHFLSRHLNVSELFNFQAPARDLTRLCAREDFERPVAKIISETGRKSRHPVFVVGIFSGQDKLGEGAGASLMEARERAAVAALKGWYLYSPLTVRVPSAMEEPSAVPWKPVHVDLGEVVV